MSAPIAVLTTETKLFAREPGTLFWVLAFPSLLLLGFGLIPAYQEVNPELGGRRIIDFYVPSVVLVGVISASLQAMPAVLTGYRERGILRRMRTTPARPSHLLAAQMVLHAAAVMLSALLGITIGRVVWDVALPREPLAYFVVLALVTSAGLAMGAVITALSRTVKAATAVGLATFFPAMFAAGIYYPIQTMPAQVRQIVELTPFGAAAQALNHAADGGWPAWVHLAVLGAWTIVLMTVAARWFRWE